MYCALYKLLNSLLCTYDNGSYVNAGATGSPGTLGDPGAPGAKGAQGDAGQDGLKGMTLLFY